VVRNEEEDEDLLYMITNENRPPWRALSFHPTNKDMVKKLN
jgi:hypothetical protein